MRSSGFSVILLLIVILESVRRWWVLSLLSFVIFFSFLFHRDYEFSFFFSNALSFHLAFPSPALLSGQLSLVDLDLGGSQRRGSLAFPTPFSFPPSAFPSLLFTWWVVLDICSVSSHLISHVI